MTSAVRQSWHTRRYPVRGAGCAARNTCNARNPVHATSSVGRLPSGTITWQPPGCRHAAGMLHARPARLPACTAGHQAQFKRQRPVGSLPPSHPLALPFIRPPPPPPPPPPLARLQSTASTPTWAPSLWACLPREETTTRSKTAAARWHGEHAQSGRPWAAVGSRGQPRGGRSPACLLARSAQPRAPAHPALPSACHAFGAFAGLWKPR